MMVCGELGIADCDFSNNAAYVASWLEKLRSDRKEIFRAAADAQRIADYLLAFHPDYANRQAGPPESVPSPTTAKRPTRRNRCPSRREAVPLTGHRSAPCPSDQPMSRPARPLPGGRARAAATTRRTTMPNDTDSFTLSLFDNTALSGWNHHTLASCRRTPTRPMMPMRPMTTPTKTATYRRSRPTPVARGSNFHLAGDRELARGWAARARDNIAAISLSKALEQSGRAPTADEQAQLLRFIGFGASELAQNCFRRPGEDEFRPDWQEIGAALEAAVTPEEYAALQRATQYAHYTPETIIRALWRAAERLGFTGGRVLEPGMGTGLFFALLPEALRDDLPAHRHRI